MQRLVCIIEGHGELEAVPVLCNRILRGILDIDVGWYIDEDPIRWPRSRLVNQSMPSPKRLPNQEQVSKALRLATSRRPIPDGILVLCDADDDCAATWGPAVETKTPAGYSSVPVAAVMASREYESWLLAGAKKSVRSAVRALQPDVAPRDAKKAMNSIVPGYRPMTHQREQTQALNLNEAWANSDSFDKLVRSLAILVGVGTPQRPRAA